MTGGSGLYSAFIHTVIDVGKAAWFIVLMISDCAVVLLRILRNTDLRSQRKRPPGCKNPQIPCDKIHIIWPSFLLAALLLGQLLERWGLVQICIIVLALTLVWKNMTDF